MKRTPIRRVSKKRAAQLRVYSKLRKDFLEKNPVCQLCNNANATDIHHGWGRIGELLNAEEHWFSICRPCHEWVHNHPSQARRQGYLL